MFNEYKVMGGVSHGVGQDEEILVFSSKNRYFFVCFFNVAPVSVLYHRCDIFLLRLPSRCERGAKQSVYFSSKRVYFFSKRVYF